MDTPGFVAVATNGALKYLDHTLSDEEGVQLMFANTLHLSLHPGEASRDIRGIRGIS